MQTTKSFVLPRKQGLICCFVVQIHPHADAKTHYLFGDGSNLTGIATSTGNILFNYDVYSSSTVTWQHPRDPSELNGNANYGGNSTFTTYGMYELIASSSSVSAIQANVWSRNVNRDITIKIFARTDTSAFNPETAVPLSSTTINHANMPHTTIVGGSLFTLPTPVTIYAGQYLYVLWESPVANELTISYFNNNSPLAPYRHGFIFGNMNADFFYGNSPAFSAATFRVYGVSSITRGSAPALGVELVLNPGFEVTPGYFSPWNNWNPDSGRGTGTVTNETIFVHSHPIAM